MQNFNYSLMLTFDELMIKDKSAVRNLARRLIAAGRNENEGEIKSHRKVISSIRKIIRLAKIKGVVVVFELRLPDSNCRADVVLLGRNSDGLGVVILLEMKHFDNTICLPDSQEAMSANMIHTDTYSDVLHPSAKAKLYKELLLNAFPELADASRFKVLSFGCAPRYKWELNPVLTHPAYYGVYSDYHCFTKVDEKYLIEIIRKELSGGEGESVWEDINRL